MLPKPQRRRLSPRSLCAVLAMICIAAWLALAGPARAQAIPVFTGQPDAGAGATNGTDEPTEEEIAPDSPRASLAAYMDLCRQSQFAEAAKYLDILPESAGRGAELARRLSRPARDMDPLPAPVAAPGARSRQLCLYLLR